MGGAISAVSRLVTRLIREEGGQDLVEYALLGISLGLACVVALNLLFPLIGTAYRTQTCCINKLSATPEPGATVAACTACP